jgi:histone-lysine N-methyltransferase SETD2
MGTVKKEEDERSAEVMMDEVRLDEPAKMNGTRAKKELQSASATPNGSDAKSPRPSASPDDAAGKNGTDGSTPENRPPPKLSRKQSQKVTSTPMLFDHLPDATRDACEAFQVINDCLYGSKNLGTSNSEPMDCDCAEEWCKLTRQSPPLLAMDMLGVAADRLVLNR